MASFSSGSFSGATGGFSTGGSTPTPATPGGISGANEHLEDRWYDGRRPGEPWQVPQWAVEERERLLQEQEEAERRAKYAALSQKLIEAGSIPPPIEAVFVGNVPLMDMDAVLGVRVPKVPEISDDEEAAAVLLMSL